MFLFFLIKLRNGQKGVQLCVLCVCVCVCCVCVCVSLLVLLCVCDGGDGALPLADVADTGPLTVHRLLPQRHLQKQRSGKVHFPNNESNYELLHYG